MLKESDLLQFCGSTEFYRHWTNRLIYTEGIKYLAEEVGAYWLIDAVASYQPSLEFQLWTLYVNEGKGTLTMQADSDQPSAIIQEIPFTDFPLEVVRFYVCDGTMMLPGEY